MRPAAPHHAEHPALAIIDRWVEAAGVSRLSLSSGGLPIIVVLELMTDVYRSTPALRRDIDYYTGPGVAEWYEARHVVLTLASRPHEPITPFVRLLQRGWFRTFSRTHRDPRSIDTRRIWCVDAELVRR